MDQGTNPRVSVIITAYNVAPFLAVAVHSALNQTVRDIEVLVADDGSTDDGMDSLASIHDPRLRLFRLSHRGPAATLNCILAEASGEYIAFLDGDDFWRADHLETQIAALDRNPHLDFTFCRSRMVNEDGSDLGPTSRWIEHDLGFGDLLVDNIVANGSAVLVRRGALDRTGPFDAGLDGGYDLDMWLRIARLRPRNIRSLPPVSVYYRRRSGQLTKSRQLMETSWQQLFAKMRGLEPELVDRLSTRARTNAFRYFAYIEYENRAFQEALKLMGQSIGADWRFALSESRTHLLLAGIVTKMILPRSWSRHLERMARRAVGGPPPAGSNTPAC